MGQDFKIRLSFEERRSGCFPAVVPWDIIAPHERQAISDYGQTLRWLNDGIGLSIVELYYVLRDAAFPSYKQALVSVEVAARYIDTRIELFNQKNKEQSK